MSPSTKNLRERIEEIIGKVPISSLEPACHVPECTRCGLEKMGQLNALTNLLSSELSLAVKGLRKAVQEGVNGNGGRYVGGGGEFSTGPGAIYSDGWDSAYDKALSSFDSKAKEILGESS